MREKEVCVDGRGASSDRSLDPAFLSSFAHSDRSPVLMVNVIGSPRFDQAPRPGVEGLPMDLGYTDGLTPVLAILEKPLPNGARAG